ncbi:MAG: CAP domain-containing protein, partial [Bacteroidia bacterium]|nr:CAP domain-containing protein [Bacteroidia bacterium]
SQSYINLAQDERYLQKNPDAIKKAVSFMLKGIKKDNGKEVLNSKFEVVRDMVVKNNDREAFKQYNTNKYAKAAKMYGQSYQIDTTRKGSYFLQAKSYLGASENSSAEIIYKDLIKRYREDYTNGIKVKDIEVDPLVYFIDKFWKASKYDSAIALITEGRELHGNDAKLNFYLRKITTDIIKDMPPSKLMLDYVQEVLFYVPTAEEFLQKENSIYIYLIKNSITNNLWSESDTIINQFVREKIQKNKLKQSIRIKETDIFIEKKTENVLWKLAEYFEHYSHYKSASYVLEKYISYTTEGDQPSDTLSRWQVISDYTYQTKSLPFACFILQEAILNYPSNEELLTLRSRVIAEKEVIRTSVDEQGALYRLVKDEFEYNPSTVVLGKLEQINSKYLGLLVSENRFSFARQVMSELIGYFPDKDHSEQLQLIAREDFYQNYFNTKTKGKDINGKEIIPFVWNGRVGGCNQGTIDSEIQNKVVDRINYFRRNAGVPEVLFDEATNEYCQKAALMMTANNALSHEPSKTWRCWSSEGAYAAKHSLLIKEANTSMAVTYIMDDKNPSAGNRRWLLYPNGRVYGHGSTNDYAVIWALDDSGTTDTAEYMNKPISWPPKGYLPQLMLMENWTFSLYADLVNATVIVSQDGKPLDVNLQPYVAGYGAPTLVFNPNYNKNTLPAKSDFEVQVSLSDGRQFNYVVHTFAYNPVR